MVKKGTRQITVATLAAAMTLSMTLTPAFALTSNDEDILDSNKVRQNSAVLNVSLSDYVNNQTLIYYTDGITEAINYNTEEDLEEGRKALCSKEEIKLIQQNFTYSNSALWSEEASSEPLYSQQWALSNDGTFTMQEEKNLFPVYDQPFEEPSGPGQWHRPNRGQSPGNSRNRGGMQGNYSASTTDTSAITSVSGIDINAETAWNIYNGGNRQVIVALIDTGVDYTDEELSNSIWINEDEIPRNGIDDDGNGYIDDVYGWNFYNKNNTVYYGEDDSHGTHCAGTIIASGNNKKGIAGIVGDTENIKLMTLKALGGSDGSGTTQAVIEAIQYAEDNGASIVNLSLGTDTFDYALYNAMKNSNLLFVVAAGNDGANCDTSPSYPAAFDLDNIISVANLQPDGSLSSSSKYGPSTIDIAAPGTYILSTTGDGEYSYMTGTSMAAPMVSAAAAMVYSYYDNMSLPQVKEVLLNSVKKLDSLESQLFSGGILDLGAALSYDVSALSSGDAWIVEEAQTTNAVETYPSVGRGTPIVIVTPRPGIENGQEAGWKVIW